jgi:cytoplasmic tRNA 2-thiolation protein 1
MIDYGERIAVGVSGGKDSLTLLSVLTKILKKNNSNDIVAITIDEGIGGYRDESIPIVRNHCEKINIPFKIFSYKDLFGTSMDEAILQRPSKKISSCSICGTFRRRALDIAAKSVNADAIATAHNLDDHIQTFMINLFSGDMDRIGWMYPIPLKYEGGLKKIKPFLELYENEIVFYAFLSGIEFQAEQCPYMNESIRSDFREFFNNLEKVHPGIKYNCYNSVNKLSKIIRNSRHDASTYLKKTCLKCGNICTNEVCSVCKTIFLLESKLH